MGPGLRGLVPARGVGVSGRCREVPVCRAGATHIRFQVALGGGAFSLGVFSIPVLRTRSQESAPTPDLLVWGGEGVGRQAAAVWGLLGILASLATSTANKPSAASVHLLPNFSPLLGPPPCTADSLAFLGHRTSFLTT